jgi:predicted metal-dependent peptidase
MTNNTNNQPATSVYTDRIEFDNLVYSVFTNNTYLLSLARKIDKLASTEIPTLGVTQNPKTGRILMIYNPEFAGSLSTSELRSVVMHEMYHIIFNHLKSLISDLKLDPKTANIAMDLEINQYLTGLPKGCLSFDLVKKELDLTLNPDRSWKHYYREIRKAQKQKQKQGNKNGEGGSGGGGSSKGKGKGSFEDSNGGSQSGDQDELEEGQFDSHAMDQKTIDDLAKNYPEISGMEDQKAKEVNQDSAFKESKRKAQLRSAELNSNKGIGSLPSRIQARIEKTMAVKDFKPNWNKILRLSVKRSKKSVRVKRTYLKKNKKLEALKGRKHRRDLPSVLIAIDQSGSVPDSFLASVAKGLNGLTKICSMDLIPFDVVCYPDEMKSYDKGSRVNYDRVAQGGTDFNPVSEYAQSKNYDLLVIVSDGEANKPKDLRGITRVYLLDQELGFDTKDKIIVIEE